MYVSSTLAEITGNNSLFGVLKWCYMMLWCNVKQTYFGALWHVLRANENRLLFPQKLREKLQNCDTRRFHVSDSPKNWYSCQYWPSLMDSFSCRFLFENIILAKHMGHLRHFNRLICVRERHKIFFIPCKGPPIIIITFSILRM